jgi:hypothetical protein
MDIAPQHRVCTVIFRDQPRPVIAKARDGGFVRLVQPHRRIIVQRRAARTGFEQILRAVAVGARAGQVAATVIAKARHTHIGQLVEAIGGVATVRIIVALPGIEIVAACQARYLAGRIVGLTNVRFFAMLTGMTCASPVSRETALSL